MFTEVGLQGPLQAGCGFGKLKTVPGTEKLLLPSPVGLKLLILKEATKLK